MATSILKLYYALRDTTLAPAGSNWELIPSNLFVIDDIEDYLATKRTPLTINNLQYIKPELEITITLDLSQTYSEPLYNGSFKYCSLELSDNAGKIYYYYVKKVIWRSKSAVKFELIMDVLNTFKEGKDYIFKDNTKITREHKDRFVKDPYSTIRFNIGTIWSDNLDTSLPITLYYSGDPVIKGTVVSKNPVYVIIRVPSQDKEAFEEVFTLGETYNFTIEDDNGGTLVLRNTEYNYFRTNVFRKIDYVNENINPILNLGEGEESNIIEDEGTPLRKDWYLVYTNTKNPTESDYEDNPVDCYLIPSSTIRVAMGDITNGKLRPSVLSSEYVYALFLYGSLTSITLSNGTTLNHSGDYIYIYSEGNTFTVLCVDPWTSVKTYNDIEYITLGTVPCDYWTAPANSNIQDLDPQYDTPAGQFNNGQVMNYLDPISMLDKTSAKLIKVIKLPYAPADFTISGSAIDLVGSDWDYDNYTVGNSTLSCLKLKDINTPLNHTFEPLQYNPLVEMNIGYTLNPALTDLRKGKQYESKLFHSEFYRPTYVYDSFQFTYQLEKLNLDSYLDDNNWSNPIKFTMTKTINSRFMFTFTNYKLNLSEENYSKYMPISRNNEVVLYSVPYINYIRTGYNYDVKNKTLSNASNWIGVGLSTASIGASLLMPTIPLKVAGVVASLVSMAMSVKSAITSTMQNENSLKQKLNQVQNQTASVNGSDDVDLMSEYAQNRLKLVVYKPNEIMENMLYQLFFYAGYNSNRMGIPNHNTRVNFDYLECDASIKQIGSIPDDCLNELINCFKMGITYIHKTDRTYDKWDITQKYENWEKSLL